MLQHGVPWQAALTQAFLSIIFFVAMMICSLLSGWFNWLSALTAFFLTIGFLIIVILIPLFLNLSRSYFKIIILLLFSHIAVSIISFAFHYKSGGLVANQKVFYPNFNESIYFSITTFTTLGYGDFQPSDSLRLTTSIEALAGMISMAIGASLIWLWCQENLVPKEMAFFDGNRRHKKSLSVTRMRIRTLTGKERELKNWVLPPEEGESFYYDPERMEWLKVTEETKLPDNPLVLCAIDESDT